MDVAVCVKHVPDTEIGVPTLLVSGRHDEATPALQHVLLDGIAGSEWVCFEEASHMPHVEDPALEGADHLGVAKALAAAISAQHYDLILCGKLATDDNAAIVGPALAEFLGLPQATAVTKLELGDGAATVHREVEGAIEVLRVALPAVITVERSINEPRYPSLPGIMKAKRTPLTTKTLGGLGLAPGEVGVAAARVEVLDLSPPPQRRAGRILQGEPPEMVKELVRLLHEEAKVL